MDIRLALRGYTDLGFVSAASGSKQTHFFGAALAVFTFLGIFTILCFILAFSPSLCFTTFFVFPMWVLSKKHPTGRPQAASLLVEHLGIRDDDLPGVATLWAYVAKRKVNSAVLRCYYTLMLTTSLSRTSTSFLGLFYEQHLFGHFWWVKLVNKPFTVWVFKLVFHQDHGPTFGAQEVWSGGGIGAPSADDLQRISLLQGWWWPRKSKLLRTAWQSFGHHSYERWHTFRSMSSIPMSYITKNVYSNDSAA